MFPNSSCVKSNSDVYTGWSSCHELAQVVAAVHHLEEQAGGVAALGRRPLVAVEDECEGFQRFTKRHVPFKRTHHSFNQAVLIASIPKMQDFGQSPAVCGLRPT